MKQSDFAKLTPRQQHTLLIAMHVRNQLEDFHAAHLNDTQMKELNQITRQAIYDVIAMIDTRSEADLAYLIKLIPEYWEIPSK